MSGAGHGWYPGDIVMLRDQPAEGEGYITDLAKWRGDPNPVTVAYVRIGNRWLEVPVDDLVWTGRSYERLPD